MAPRGPMQISEAFREAGFWFRVGDYQFRFTCTCGAQQALDACEAADRDGITVYTCKRCGTDIAGVTKEHHVDPLGGRAPDGDGHNMIGYVFGAKVDMELWPPAANEPFLRIQRRPGFFRRVGPQAS